MKRRVVLAGVAGVLLFAHAVDQSEAAAPRPAILKCSRIFAKLVPLENPTYSDSFWLPGGRNDLTGDVQEVMTALLEGTATADWCPLITSIGDHPERYFDLGRTPNDAVTDFQRDWGELRVLAGCDPVVIERITPMKGASGRIAVIHGVGFKTASAAGGTLVVEFGAIPALAVVIPGSSDNQLIVTIPGRDPREPSLTVPVTVRLVVDGEEQPVLYLNGPLTFRYATGQLPQITGFSPAGISAKAPFQLTVQGANFVRGSARRPIAVHLVGTEHGVVVGEANLTSSPTSIVADIATGLAADAYVVVVEFSDGAGADSGGLSDPTLDVYLPS